MPKDYFLGANTGKGFVSFFSGFAGPEDQLWVLKGGPGCGKSSFLRRIAAAAEAEGMAVEYAHCSADPDSLDGIYIPALATAFADGTAPHVLEPACPGAGGGYIDLGAYYDNDALRPLRPRLEALRQAAAEKRAEARALLAEAEELHHQLEALYNPHVDFDGVYRTADRFIEKLIG